MAKRLGDETPDKFGGVINAQALANYVGRVSRLMEEQKSLAEDIKNVCAEADEGGIASKREIRKLAREALMEPEVLQAQLSRMDDLRKKLGEFVTTPLGEAAERAEAVHATPTPKPRPFSEQPVGPPRPRGRPRKTNGTAASVDDALARARAHFGDDDGLPPAG